MLHRKDVSTLYEQIYNDSNTAKIYLLLPGIIQHVNSIKKAQQKMRCDFKENIQKITSHKEDVTMEKFETTVQHSVNSTLAKLGRFMATLKVDSCMEIVERMEDTEVETASSYDEQYITTTSTAENKIGYEVYNVPEKFLDIELIMIHWYKYADVNEKWNGPNWRLYVNSTERKKFTRM